MLRTVTVVFTDLVGSTELRVTLGDDRADALGREHDRLVRGALLRAGGEIVKSLGDGIMAVFPAAASAVIGCVAAQREVKRVARRWPQVEVSMRVGVSVGDAVEQTGDWQGTPVVEAARLCALAQGGQILVSGMVPSLAGSRVDYRFHPHGSVDLKGLPSMEAFEVETARPPSGNTTVLPAPLQQALSSAFVGREDDRAEIASIRTDVVAGSRRTVLLFGEPGAGKSRLAAEVAHDAADDGWTVLFGRCDEHLSVPYQPIVEALGRALPTIDDTTLKEHVAEQGGELLRLLPQLQARVPDVPDWPPAELEMARYRLYEAVADLVRRVALPAPTMFVIDDLQWATEPTLRLLQHLAADSEPAAVFLVMTHRHTDVDPADLRSSILADVLRVPGIDQRELESLGRDDVVQLVEASTVLTGDEATEVADDIFREGAGNPFFTEQLLHEVTDAGGLALRANALDQMAPVPVAVRQLVRDRVRRLGDSTHHTIEVAALVEGPFSVVLLERVSGRSGDALINDLDRGARAGILFELADAPGFYNFRHSIVRHALTNELPAWRRAKGHLGLANALAAGDPGDREPAVLAHHAREAVPAGFDVTDAVALSIEAARVAVRRLAPEEASEQLDRAEEVLRRARNDRPRSHFEIAAARAEVACELLDPVVYQARVLEAIDLAVDHGQPEWIGEIDLHYARTTVGDDDRTLLTRLGELIPQMGPNEPRARCTLLASYAYQQLFNEDSVTLEPMALEAFEIAKHHANEERLAGACLVHALTMQDPRHHAGRVRRFEQALELSSACDPSSREAFNYRMAATRWLGLARLVAGDRTYLDEHLPLLEKEAAAAGSTMDEAHTRQLLAMMALVDGRFGEVEGLAGRVLELAAQDPNYRLAYAAQMVALRREQGRSGEVLPVLRSVAAASAGQPALEAAIALTVTDIDERHEGEAELDTKSLLSIADGPHDLTWPAPLAFLAEVAARHNDRRLAASLERGLRPYAGLFILAAASGVQCFATADRSLGQVALAQGRFDEAIRFLDQSLDLDRRVRSDPMIARTQLWRATAWLARSGRAGEYEAAAALAEAHGIAERLGMIELSREAENHDAFAS